MELPYILFHTGHFYEAYQIYNKLAKEMWKNKRYALFFICIFNIHSVSWPAIREIEDKPGTETDTIRKQYVTTDLNTELNQLRLPGNYSAPYYMISCLAVVLQQGMRCISNFRSS